MRHTISASVALSTALAMPLWLGCHQSPRVTYEPRIEMADLAAGLKMSDNAHLLLTEEGTQGLFGCGLAMAKLMPVYDENGRRLELVSPKPNEEANWTEQMRGVPEIRDMLFLSPLDMRTTGSRLDGLCSAAERLGAALLLAYAPNHFDANSAQVLGVLYDTRSRGALATLHASAQFVDEDGEEIPPADERGDHREVDAAFQASRAFEHHTLACLWELIRRDSPPPTTQPHRWQTPRPDRCWLSPVTNPR